MIHINSRSKTLCLGDISKDFTIDNLNKKRKLKGSVKSFSADFNPIDTHDILNIHRHLIKRT